ncbi:MAG: mandelate racemase/muconate lactonizing enzyme family protein [Bradyrhizobium sp.]
MHVSLHTANLHYGGDLVLHTASSGSVHQLSELYLRIDDGDVAGVGEVRANISYLNRLTVDEVKDAAIAAISGVDWSRDPTLLLSTMGGWAARFHAPIRMLIDCALHDLIAKRAGVSVAALLGTTATPLQHTNQTLFWSSFDDFVARASAYVDRGFLDLKVRVGVSGVAEDLRRIAELRRLFGQRITIAADANGQWSEAEARDNLKQLAEFDLAYIEQPTAAGDWRAIERLALESPVKLMLDESMATAGDVARICGLGGRVWAHLKLVKLGGIAPTIAAARDLAAAGVPFMIGQMNEGAAATAAALHVAAATSPAFAELYGADGLIDDPTSGVVYADGTVRSGSGPGLGIGFDVRKAHLLGEF